MTVAAVLDFWYLLLTFLINFLKSLGFFLDYGDLIYQSYQCNLKVENGKVDGQRLCITGKSAGGYTALACLAFRNTFKAGASLYGVSCLTA